MQEANRVDIIKYCINIIGGVVNLKILAKERVLIDVNDLPDFIFNEPLEYNLRPEDVVKHVNILIQALMQKSV